MASTTFHTPIDPETQSLSTRQLLTRLLETVSLLVTKEVELARAEIRANIKAELSMVALLIAAGVVAVFAVNMLLVSAVFALTVWIPGWLAALALAGLLLAVGAVLALVGWQRRVSTPMAVTRKLVKEEVQWARNDSPNRRRRGRRPRAPARRRNHRRTAATGRARHGARPPAAQHDRLAAPAAGCTRARSRLGVLVVAVSVTAPVALARVRARRRSSLLGRGAELREKARRFGQAFERITEDPDRLAPTPGGLGSRTAVAVAAMVGAGSGDDDSPYRGQTARALRSS